MKKLNISLIFSLTISLFVITSVLIDNHSVEKNSYEYLSQELTNAKDFTLEVLQNMPAENYDFQPANEMRTFREQAYHIAYSLEWFNAQLKGEPIAWAPGDEDSLDKKALIDYTRNQFEAFISIINEAEESGAFTRGVLSTLRHNSHHRGQMVAYYRANEMAPPSYR